MKKKISQNSTSSDCPILKVDKDEGLGGCLMKIIFFFMKVRVDTSDQEICRIRLV